MDTLLEEPIEPTENDLEIEEKYREELAILIVVTLDKKWNKVLTDPSFKPDATKVEFIKKWLKNNENLIHQEGLGGNSVWNILNRISDAVYQAKQRIITVSGQVTDISGTVYASATDKLERAKAETKKIIDHLVYTVLNELFPQAIDRALEILSVIKDVIPLNFAADQAPSVTVFTRAQVAVNSMSVLCTGKKIPEADTPKFWGDLESLINSSDPRKTFIAIIQKYITSQKQINNMVNNVLHMFIKDKNSVERESIFGKIDMPQVGPGMLANWMNNKETYLYTETVLVYEEYSFRRTVFCAIDSYIKNNALNVGGKSQSVGASAPAASNRLGFQQLADIVEQVVPTLLRKLFVSPGLSFGGPNNPIDKPDNPPDNIPYAHMRPSQRKEYALSKLTYMLPNMVAMPVTAGLNLLLNGAWEVSSFNPALVDLVSRTYPKIYSTLVESILQGIFGSFQILEVYDEDDNVKLREGGAVYKIANLNPSPIVSNPTGQKLALSVISAYRDFPVANDAMRKLFEIQNQKIEKLLEKISEHTTLKSVLDNTAKDIMAYASAVYGDSFDAENHDSSGIAINHVDQTITVEFEIRKDMPTVPILYCVSGGAVTLFPKPKEIEGKWLYVLEEVVLGKQIKIFSNYGNVVSEQNQNIREPKYIY